MNYLQFFWGEGEHINALQMSARSLVMFLIALTLIRIGGLRIFGKKSDFDNVVVIMLGAVLARGVVGASSFFATVAAGLVMIIIHRLMAWATFKNKRLADLLKGKEVILFKDGKIQWQNMQAAAISEKDLMESLRLETSAVTLNDIETILLETNGRISFVKK